MTNYFFKLFLVQHNKYKLLELIIYQASIKHSSSSLVTKSCLTLVTPWTVALQAPLSMGFSRQEYWSGLPFPSLGDLSNPGIEPVSLTSPTLTGGFFTTSTTWEALGCSSAWCFWLSLWGPLACVFPASPLSDPSSPKGSTESRASHLCTFKFSS